MEAETVVAVVAVVDGAVVRKLAVDIVAAAAVAAVANRRLG